MLKLFLLITLFVGLSMLLLCIRIILEKNGRFGSEHIGHSKAMRKKGIHCVHQQYKI